jgi:predicted nucleic acid-binding protein
MFIVDTNIVVYLLMHGDRTAAAQRLHARDPDWRSEAFLLVEFTNVLASSIAMNRMTFNLADELLAKAIGLFDGRLARVDHSLVLAIAGRHGISAYDARFLALADQLGTRLVTEDAKLRAAAPRLTESLTEALGKE